ncbi:chaperonin 10-like protein [Cadophora sp. MPI-SDFR-AT-0126]|nr:chaperonin 10-like protein [Leotiomycetes sp. MPI-SDFR-AT-0126]
MATQTALALTEIAKPLTKITIPVPDPKEHQLLIKISYAGITPLDQKLRDYNVFNIGSNLPAILAFDLVGEVVKTGPNTSVFPVGSKVFSQALFSVANSLCGGLQEYTLIDERYTALVPKNISEADAAIFPINAFTSATALFTGEGLNGGFGFPFPGTPQSETFDYKSITLVIIGGGTACGKFAVQFARIAGIGRIIVTASLDSEAELRGYGATHVLDRKASDVAAQVKALAGDDLVYLYDTFNRGDHTFGVSLLSSSKKGTLLHLIPGQVDKKVAAQKKAGFEERQLSGASTLHPDLAVLFWKVFPEWVEKGEVKVIRPYKVIEGLDADKINAALDGHRDGVFDRWNVHI